MQPSLFPENNIKQQSSVEPLAARLRPNRLVDFIGQKHLLGPGKLLDGMIKNRTIQSMIFWGPPGCGKTTLAYIVGKEWNISMISLSAVLGGVKDVRQAIEIAKDRWKGYEVPTILFIDEIHRFNKAQQDALLPHVEKGTITLIGATTENPSFAVISPLLSRVKVLTLNPLTDDELEAIIRRALKDRESGFGRMSVKLNEDVCPYLVALSDSDARVALNLLETAVLNAGKDESGRKVITKAFLSQICQKKHLLYDKSGEEHYNLISALHKSMRGSDPDAGLYYLARMLVAGEDPLYIGRRLVRFASEDVGLVDPNAMHVTLSAVQAYQMLGQPEGELALAEAVVYLATAPKSNALYLAYEKVKEVVKEKGALPVPFKLRNAPTKLMKELGYGEDYQYPHYFEEAFVEEDYLPKPISGLKFYFPTERGEERAILERLKKWRRHF